MTSNNTNNNNNTIVYNNSFNTLTDEHQIQFKIYNYHLEAYRQSSIKSSKHPNKNDLHTKINRL
jgi:hypothetical protein